eukprot:1199618-Pleurochrysis_carterae.AAC.2
MQHGCRAPSFCAARARNRCSAPPPLSCLHLSPQFDRRPQPPSRAPAQGCGSRFSLEARGSAGEARGVARARTRI